jgi:hypothetical protein
MDTTANGSRQSGRGRRASWACQRALILLTAFAIAACSNNGGVFTSGTKLRFKNKDGPGSQSVIGPTQVLAQSIIGKGQVWNFDKVEVYLYVGGSPSVTLAIKDGPSSTAATLASHTKTVAKSKWIEFKPRTPSGGLVTIQLNTTYYVHVSATGSNATCSWPMSYENVMSNSRAYKNGSTTSYPTHRDHVIKIWSLEEF